MQVVPGRRVRLDRPGGQMWSVVTESPKIASGRAPMMSQKLPGSMLNFSKYGGSWM